MVHCNNDECSKRGTTAAAHVKRVEDVPEVLDCRPAAIVLGKSHASPSNGLSLSRARLAGPEKADEEETAVQKT